jgi:hypothetical protein
VNRELASQLEVEEPMLGYDPVDTEGGAAEETPTRLFKAPPVFLDTNLRRM